METLNIIQPKKYSSRDSTLARIQLGTFQKMMLGSRVLWKRKMRSRLPVNKAAWDPRMDSVMMMMSGPMLQKSLFKMYYAIPGASIPRAHRRTLGLSHQQYLNLVAFTTQMLSIKLGIRSYSYLYKQAHAVSTKPKAMVPVRRCLELLVTESGSRLCNFLQL